MATVYSPSRALGALLHFFRRASRRIRMLALRPLFRSYGKRFIFDPDGFYSFANITVGDDVALGYQPVMMAALSEIRIGCHVMFGPQVVVIGGGHNFKTVGAFMTDVHEKTGDEDLGVTIEDDVWVGARATILRGGDGWSRLDNCGRIRRNEERSSVLHRRRQPREAPQVQVGSGDDPPARVAGLPGMLEAFQRVPRGAPGRRWDAPTLPPRAGPMTGGRLSRGVRGAVAGDERCRVLLVSPLPPPAGGIARWTTQLLEQMPSFGDIEVVHVDIAPRWRAVHSTSIVLRLVGGLVQGVRDASHVCACLVSKRPDVAHLCTSGSLALLRDACLLLVARAVRLPVAYHVRMGRRIRRLRLQKPRVESVRPGREDGDCGGRARCCDRGGASTSVPVRARGADSELHFATDATGVAAGRPVAPNTD